MTSDDQENPEFNLDSEDVLLAPGEPLKIVRREPQIPYPLHTHSFAELVIILSGTGHHRVAGQLLPIAAGDVFVILGNRAHGYEDLSELYLVNLFFDPAILETRTYDLSRLPGFHALFTLEPQWRGEGDVTSHLKLDSTRLDKAMNLIERIEDEIKCGEDGYRYMAVVHFMRLAGELSRWYSGAQHPGARRLSRIGAAIGYLEQHLDEAVTLDELTGLADLSASTLNRAFRRAVGLPPLAYHLRLRIRRAGDLLRTTDLSVTEVAGLTGFDDANYFARQFRNVMGLSPSVYRIKAG
ncbi:MAG: AraC family transcriptional regulator [Spirochaetes bacterium]|nr:MAG: AraC family transcriptional regulator [Spirochaetota bacterium]